MMHQVPERDSGGFFLLVCLVGFFGEGFAFSTRVLKVTQLKIVEKLKMIRIVLFTGQ